MHSHPERVKDGNKVARERVEVRESTGRDAILKEQKMPRRDVSGSLWPTA